MAGKISTYNIFLNLNQNLLPVYCIEKMKNDIATVTIPIEDI